MKNDSKYRYTLYRNSDDCLLLLDATAEACAALIHVSMNTLYKMSMVGGNGTWTIIKCSKEQIKKDMEG